MSVPKWCYWRWCVRKATQFTWHVGVQCTSVPRNSRHGRPFLFWECIIRRRKSQWQTEASSSVTILSQTPPKERPLLAFLRHPKYASVVTILISVIQSKNLWRITYFTVPCVGGITASNRESWETWLRKPKCANPLVRWLNQKFL